MKGYFRVVLARLAFAALVAADVAVALAIAIAVAVAVAVAMPKGSNQHDEGKCKVTLCWLVKVVEINFNYSVNYYGIQ